MLCFRWQGGAACASTSEAGALPASSTAIYKTPEDGPLPKHSQSLQSAKTPHSQPSLSPTHSKGTGGDTALATPAQVSAAQDKVGKKRFEPWRNHVRIEMLLIFYSSRQSFSDFLLRSVQHAGTWICTFLKPNMRHQLFAIDLILICMSCGASALATSIPAVSTFNFTNRGAAHNYGTDTTSKIRRRRYISQNDMLAILDYHNKVRGKVFPPASNMEYMVSFCLTYFYRGLSRTFLEPYTVYLIHSMHYVFFLWPSSMHQGCDGE